MRYECLQPKYNLVIRDEYERELEPLCLEQEVGVIPYSSLASGFLSGKYRAGEALPKTARAGGVEKNYMNERGFRVLAAVEKVAAARERDRRAGLALVARAPARHHRADRERDHGAAAQGAGRRHRAEAGRRGDRRPRPGERLAGGLEPRPA